MIIKLLRLNTKVGMAICTCINQSGNKILPVFYVLPFSSAIHPLFYQRKAMLI